MYIGSSRLRLNVAWNGEPFADGFMTLIGGRRGAANGIKALDGQTSINADRGTFTSYFPDVYCV